MRALFLICFASFFGCVHAQNTAIIDVSGFLMKKGDKPDHYDVYSWWINGQKMDRKKSSATIKIHYPGFDTIKFYDGKRKDLVITRFKPGKKYTLTIGCCAEGFDIYDFENIGVYTRGKESPEDEPDTLIQRMESPYVSFKILNKKDKDTIMGSFCDNYACLWSGMMLFNNKPTPFAGPAKSGMADNKNYISICKYDWSFKNTEGVELGYKDITDKGEFGLWCEEVKDIARIHTRFFYQEKILATYDCKTKKLKLEILK